MITLKHLENFREEDLTQSNSEGPELDGMMGKLLQGLMGAGSGGGIESLLGSGSGMGGGSDEIQSLLKSLTSN